MLVEMSSQPSLVKEEDEYLDYPSPGSDHQHTSSLGSDNRHTSSLRSDFRHTSSPGSDHQHTSSPGSDLRHTSSPGSDLRHTPSPTLRHTPSPPCIYPAPFRTSPDLDRLRQFADIATDYQSMQSKLISNLLYSSFMAAGPPQEDPIDLRMKKVEVRDIIDLRMKKEAEHRIVEGLERRDSVESVDSDRSDSSRIGFSCEECGKGYSSSSNLARHRQSHRTLVPGRKCTHCDREYASPAALAMHMRTHGAGCQCPYCGKNFSRPWLLQGHIRTHTGEKPFSCSVCAKSFADKSNLRAHTQTHSTDKPFSCANCGKAFALKSYLSKHEESSCFKNKNFRSRRTSSGSSVSSPEPCLQGLQGLVNQQAPISFSLLAASPLFNQTKFFSRISESTLMALQSTTNHS